MVRNKISVIIICLSGFNIIIIKEGRSRKLSLRLSAQESHKIEFIFTVFASVNVYLVYIIRCCKAGNDTVASVFQIKGSSVVDVDECFFLFFCRTQIFKTCVLHCLFNLCNFLIREFFKIRKRNFITVCSYINFRNCAVLVHVTGL